MAKWTQRIIQEYSAPLDLDLTIIIQSGRAIIFFDSDDAESAAAFLEELARVTGEKIMNLEDDIRINYADYDLEDEDIARMLDMSVREIDANIAALTAVRNLKIEIEIASITAGGGLA